MWLVVSRDRERIPTPTGGGEDALASLLVRHRAGDPAALNALMTELYPSVHRIVYRLAGPRSRGTHEDLVQTALEQVCRSLDAFEGRSRLTTFVFGICHRVVARSRRYERVRNWFKLDAEEACTPDDPLPQPDEGLVQREALATARAALARLDAEERSAFVLHELEELPLEEVAVALNCSTRTVKRRLRSAREALLATKGAAS
jgi:RNA polymerase sigma-70 factor (ECF subfamily)